MQDRRQPPDTPQLDPDLVAEAQHQLESEIAVIRRWLAELDETSKDNPAALAARKSYGDMIRSRQDLLQNLDKSNKR